MSNVLPETKVPTIVDPFKNMVDLMAVYSAAFNELSELETEANGLLLELIDDKRADYARVQKALTESEAALEMIAREHPEWFQDKRSVTTPYGTAKFTRSTKLKVDDEEVTIILIERLATEDKSFDASGLIVPSKKLNLEALEKLDPLVLAKLRVEIERKDNFKVEEAKVNMGKAVKDAQKKADKQEKAAAKKKEGK